VVLQVGQAHGGGRGVLCLEEGGGGDAGTGQVGALLHHLEGQAQLALLTLQDLLQVVLAQGQLVYDHLGEEGGKCPSVLEQRQSCAAATLKWLISAGFLKLITCQPYNIHTVSIFAF
jgi:hypothetical protein